MRLIFVVLLFVSSLAKAQFASEVGVVGGAAYYMGDINTSKQLYNPSFALGGIYKMNFNDRYALRLNVLFSKLEASDSDFSNEIQRARNHSFKTELMDMSAEFEFNFLPFWLPAKNKTYKWTPYVHAGLGFALTNNDPGFNFPFGVGVKYLLKGNIVLGTEWSFKKTFSDNLDNLSDPWKSGESSFWVNNDWYSYIGITLTYRFPLDRECHKYDKLFK